MNQNNMFFSLFANCIPVKGNKRSLICDLQRSHYIVIPNLLFDIALLLRTHTIKKIKKKYNNELNEGIDTYFKWLSDNDWGFFTNTPKEFPKLSLEWKSPYIITNAILDIDNKSEIRFQDVINQINELGCNALQIRNFGDCCIEKIEKILASLEGSRVQSAEVLINSNQCENLELVLKKLKKFNRVRVIGVFESPEEIIIDENSIRINYTSTSLNSAKHCGFINENFFAINIQTFTEAQKHNTCLNRKISIDTEGNIKNCPSMKESFGNIKDTTLAEALEKPGFKQYWNITKDQIDVCKDCEFRYICTDCRAYVENPEDMYSKPLKCGYNPYTCEWEEWSTNPLKEKAIKFYGMEELAKKQN